MRAASCAQYTASSRSPISRSAICWASVLTVLFTSLIWPSSLLLTWASAREASSFCSRIFWSVSSRSSEMLLLISRRLRPISAWSSCCASWCSVSRRWTCCLCWRCIASILLFCKRSRSFTCASRRCTAALIWLTFLSAACCCWRIWRDRRSFSLCTRRNTFSLSLLNASRCALVPFNSAVSLSILFLCSLICRCSAVS